MSHLLSNDTIAALALETAEAAGVKNTKKYALGPGYHVGAAVGSIVSCNLHCMVNYDIDAACNKIFINGEAARFTAEDRTMKIEDFRKRIVEPLVQKVLAA